MVCRQCPLYDPEHVQVAGRGSVDAVFAWVADHPDGDAEKARIPFPVDVTRPHSVASLTETALKNVVKLDFDRIWVAYALRCNPYHQKPLARGQRAPKQRKITLTVPKHMGPCSKMNLEPELLALPRLQIVVAAGDVAAKSLLGAGASVLSTRGRWWPRRIGNQEVLVRTTFSAATVNRLQAWTIDDEDATRPRRVKREYWPGSVPWMFGKDLEAVAREIKERGLV